MNWQKKALVVCVGSLLSGLPIHLPYFSTLAWGIQANTPRQQKPNQLSEQQLSQLAQSITVKVLTGEGWGSGILIHRKGQVYTVLTNKHVLEAARGNSYKIQTPDGQIYPANPVKIVIFDCCDLGLIAFHSNRNYSLGSIGASPTPTIGDEVFAAGFPFDPDLPKPKGFTFTNGQILMLSNKAFARGYQIGYTNQIEKGMSGGPLLNSQGQVIGINGVHSNPLWGNPYIFTDGSVASKAMREQMSQLSWAIPIQTFLQLESKFSAIPANSFLKPSPSSPLEIEKTPSTQPSITVDPKPPIPQPKLLFW